jgi:hypothetical protein
VKASLIVDDSSILIKSIQPMDVRDVTHNQGVILVGILAPRKLSKLTGNLDGTYISI